MLTTDQIDEFHRDGLLVLRQVLDHDHVARLRAAVDETTARGVARDGHGHWYETIDGVEQYFRTDGILDYHRTFRETVVMPELLAIVGQLMGHPFLPINDTVVTKLPHSGVPILWHQDPPYAGDDPRSTTFGVPNFDIDIYLDAATTSNGCLYGIVGHHLVGHVDLGGRDEDELFDLPQAQPIEMEPGDVLVHCMSSPHGSRGNDSNEIRRVVYFHYMAREVLETLYGTWATKRPLFGNADLDRSHAFTEHGITPFRELVDSAGVADQLATAQVSLTDRGFEFIGEPKTPPWHWTRLADGIDPRTRQAMQTLSTL